MLKNTEELLLKLIKTNPPKTEAEVLHLKRQLAKQTGTKMMNKAELLAIYRQLVKVKKLKPNQQTESILKKRHVRTLSGVAPIAVLTKPFPCPGKCVYCPTERQMPKSYLSNEPAVMRAQLCDFHPFKQVALRIQALQNNGHQTDKLELIVMGGTWNHLPKKYQLWYVYSCFKAANNPLIKVKNQKSKVKNASQNSKSIKDKKDKIEIPANIKLKNQSQVTWADLYAEQKKNEKAKCRIIGLTLETRPDSINFKEALKMREFGCTRVEIGVQHLDNEILKLSQRGHGVEQTIEATKILRSLGFKITYHMMLNLPGSNPTKDFKMFQQLFSDPNFQPDQIKIYPCVVNKFAPLYKIWKAKKYRPYTDAQLKKLLIKIKSIVPPYVRIIRVIRDIPEESIEAGNKITNLRHLLKTDCKCIRCREVGHQLAANNKQPTTNNKIPKLVIRKYKVSTGTEYFLSYESPDEKILYAFCRLHIPKTIPLLTKEGVGEVNKTYWIHSTPIIRELHTYGQMVSVNGKMKSASQHKGLGKKLILQAEKIAKKNKFSSLAVISGIGVREYYKNQGYKLKDTYLVKTF